MSARPASRVPITIDEAPNRTDLLQSYTDLVTLKHVSANNHILNSVLRKFCVDLFGNTPLILRVPSLLAHALFLWTCMLLCKRIFHRPAIQVAAFLILNLNPFLFEFWGYSRGYGLAIGFLISAILAFIVYVQDGSKRHVWISLVAAAAAVMSNFALLNFYIALCAVLLLEPLWKERRLVGIHITALPVLLVSAGLASLIFNPIRKLREAGELYYGGDTDVITNTITSLARESLFSADGELLPVQIVVWSFNILSVLSALLYLHGFARRRTDAAFQTGMYFFFLVGIVLLSLLVQHELFGTRYLIDRTALFIIPLVMLYFMHTLCLAGRRMPKVTVAVLTLLAGFQLFNVVRNFNLSRSHVWWLDNHTGQVVERLSARASALSRPLKLRTSWILMPAADYYIYTRYNELFTPLEYVRSSPGLTDSAYDYLYFPRVDLDTIANVYVVDTILDDNLYLYRRRSI